RADVQAARDHAASVGRPTNDLDAIIGELDAQIRAAGVRGTVVPDGRTKRSRSTRRRQDAPDLPKRPREARTLGRVYTAPDGRTYRPSLFITLTLPSYGRVNNGVPVDPDSYDYAGRLGTRCTSPSWWIGSCRTCAGWRAMTCSTSPPSNRK